MIWNKVVRYPCLRLLSDIAAASQRREGPFKYRQSAVDVAFDNATPSNNSHRKYP